MIPDGGRKADQMVVACPSARHTKKKDDAGKTIRHPYSLQEELRLDYFARSTFQRPWRLQYS